MSMWSALGCPEEGRGSCLGLVRCPWVSPVAGAVLPEGRGCPGGGVCAPCSSLCLQEKMKGKNKLVPRLLGITKECVMRVDEKTKEVIQEWNLTNIKRWAASPKSFTLVTPPPPARPGLAMLPPGICHKPFPQWRPHGPGLPLGLSLLQRGGGSAWLSPCRGLPGLLQLLLLAAGFWGLPGWLLLRADDRRGTDCPAHRWLH